MNFCQPHWDLLREKINAAGLSSLIADNGVEAVQKMAEQLQTGETNLSNYDPLLGAMFALANHAFIGIGPENTRMAVMNGGCPVCIANTVHEISCEEEGCELKFERFFDNAVSDEVDRFKKLLLGETE